MWARKLSKIAESPCVFDVVSNHWDCVMIEEDGLEVEGDFKFLDVAS